VFTGTITAYLTLVVTKTPKERMGFAIGVINSAVFFGNSVSPLLGGMFADLFGYRASFFVAGGLLFVAFLLSIIFVQESFKPSSAPASVSFFADLKSLVVNPDVFSIVGMLFVYALSQNIQKPLLPLMVQNLGVVNSRLATYAGIVNSAAGVAAVLAGILIGAIIDRWKTLKLGIVCALLGGLLVFLIVFITNVWHLVALSFLFAFFSGGLEPILKVLLARIVPIERRGSAFGLSSSASSLGWSAGALSGGVCAAMFGLNSIFVISAVFFVGIAGLLVLIGRGKEY
jgi:DHA1 family multidrug resistance protein-like MFS transporter